MSNYSIDERMCIVTGDEARQGGVYDDILYSLPVILHVYVSKWEWGLKTRQGSWGSWGCIYSIVEEFE